MDPQYQQYPQYVWLIIFKYADYTSIKNINNLLQLDNDSYIWYELLQRHLPYKADIIQQSSSIITSEIYFQLADQSEIDEIILVALFSLKCNEYWTLRKYFHFLHFYYPEFINLMNFPTIYHKKIKKFLYSLFNDDYEAYLKELVIQYPENQIDSLTESKANQIFDQIFNLRHKNVQNYLGKTSSIICKMLYTLIDKPLPRQIIIRFPIIKNNIKNFSYAICFCYKDLMVNLQKYIDLYPNNDITSYYKLMTYRPPKLVYLNGLGE